MVQPHEPEFEQAFNEIASTLKSSSLFQKHPEFERALEVVSIPERVIQFRVVWENDKGELQVNRGYRVQFNSVLGPYKGGLRFHPSVNLSILKFLGFEQIFKNALTGEMIGGGKGGSDFNPKGKTDAEIRRFCVSFMSELSRHIGPDTDVPAGDIGVGAREVGYLFGAYRRIKNSFQGVLTGKGLTWGGSLIRPEATGFGLVYYVDEMIKYATEGKESFKGKKVAVSGAGNVAQYAALKAIELGATVVSLSDSKGVLLVPQGVTPKQIEEVGEGKILFKSLEEISTSSKTFTTAEIKYIPNDRPWVHVGKVDIALPCATQNEVSGDEAKALIANGCKYVAEGSNMGSTQDAIDIFEEARASSDKSVWYAPGKAANAGGVAVSAIEMAQNSQRVSYTSEEVDDQLKKIMITCFDNCVKTAKEYTTQEKDAYPSLVAGANIAGFVKVAKAMFVQGDVF